MEGSTFDDYFRGIAKQLIRIGIASPREIAGCSEEEIREIESQANGCLPAAYKSFLRIMGRRAGSFFVGSALYYPKIRELQDAATRLVRDDGAGFELPCGAFIFAMHQGYQFAFFCVDSQNDDPPVFHYLEGDGVAKHLNSFFTEFVSTSVDEHAQLIKRR